MIAKVVNPTDKILLHLDTPYKIDKVYSQTGTTQQGLRYEHRDGKLMITFPARKQAGETFEDAAPVFGPALRNTLAVHAAAYLKVTAL